MRAVFTIALLTSLGSTTRKASDVQGQTYLGSDTIHIEFDAGAIPMVVKESALPNSSGVLDSLAENSLLMPVQSSLLDSSGGLRRDGMLRLSEVLVSEVDSILPSTPDEVGHTVSQNSSILPKMSPFSPTGGNDARPLSCKTTQRTGGKDCKDYTYLKLLGLGGFGGTWSAVPGRPEIIEQFAAQNHDAVEMYNDDLLGWIPQVYARVEGALNRMPRLKAQIDNCPQLWAIKASTKTKGSLKEKEKLEIWNEVHILQTVHGNPYVSQFEEAFHDEKGRYYIVMEYFPGGNMFDAVIDGEYSMEDAKGWFHDLWRGLTSIHGAGVAHRDIKLDNLVFTEDKKPRFIDFGFAVQVKSETETYSQKVGTLSYAAPDVFLGPYLPKAVDIWSLGVVLFLMVSGANGQGAFPPFNEKFPRGRKWTPALARQLSRRLGANSEDQNVIKILEIMLSTDPDYRLKNFNALLDMWK